jgi:hypothetical protein
MRELILLIVALLECNEDAQVVGAGNDADARTSELGAQLVKAPGRNALFGAIDVKSGNGRVVGGLLSKVGDLDELVARGAHGAARGRRVWSVFDGRRSIFDLPGTLRKLVDVGATAEDERTLKNSPKVELYGLHGLPLTYFCAPISPRIQSAFTSRVPDPW